VIEANSRALGMSGDGFVIKGRRIIAAAPGQQRVLDQLITGAFAQAGLRAASEPIALKRPSGKKPLIVSAAAMRDGLKTAASGLFGGDRVALLTIVDPEEEVGKAGAKPFVLLGLTDAEAKVATILGSGASPDMAASQLGLSTGTIRIHLNRIYSKLDISRQSELVVLAGQLGALAVL
jgi:DNA-binding CsgD family transcriptional regulator